MVETIEVEKGMSIFLDVFRRADKKDDGKISWEEFVGFFADGVMGKEELRTLFDEIDTHNTNYIDPKELCEYFSIHLGPFKEIFSLMEEFNTKISNLLLSTSQTYKQSTRKDQFITRFLMGEVLNQVHALTVPLDSATDALGQQAKEERSDITPVQADDVKEKKTDGLIVPGRVVRRAKRQTSSQTSHEGVLQGTREALETQVERLTSLLDRMEKRVNFDGLVDEEVDVSDDNKVLVVQMDMNVAEGQMDTFKGNLRSYIEGANAAPGCLSVTVRSYKESNLFSIYEIWTNESQLQTYNQTDAGEAFKKSWTTTLDGDAITRSVLVPDSYKLKEFANDNFKFDKNGRKFSKRVEAISTGLELQTATWWKRD